MYFMHILYLRTNLFCLDVACLRDDAPHARTRLSVRSRAVINRARESLLRFVSLQGHNSKIITVTSLFMTLLDETPNFEHFFEPWKSSAGNTSPHIPTELFNKGGEEEKAAEGRSE